MIVDGILNILKVVVNVLLAPLEIINFGVDFLEGLPIVSSFIQVIAFIFPWSNILPIIYLVIGLFSFRAIVALIKTIWALLPIV